MTDVLSGLSAWRARRIAGSHTHRSMTLTPPRGPHPSVRFAQCPIWLYSDFVPDRFVPPGGRSRPARCSTRGGGRKHRPIPSWRARDAERPQQEPEPRQRARSAGFACGERPPFGRLLQARPTDASLANVASSSRPFGSSRTVARSYKSLPFLGPAEYVNLPEPVAARNRHKKRPPKRPFLAVCAD